MNAQASEVKSVLDAAAVRADFPLLHRTVHGRPLVYLDNAATTQKPAVVIDAIADYYRTINANVHRGVHWLSDQATAAYEDARTAVAAFVNAASADEIVWTRGTTESINLVAASYARPRLREGDEILVSGMAHHSNIVPWQLAAQGCGARVIPIPVTAQGELDLAAYAALLGPRTRIVALEHASNVLGSVHPLKRIIDEAHAAGAIVLVDGAQSIAHLDVDVQALGADFYAFSGHKMYGPTGIGVLYGRRELLDAMPPYQGGGMMIEQVTFERTTFAALPHKFEAGTPHIAGAVGLAAAVGYLRRFERAQLEAHEHALLERALSRAATMPGLQRIGNPARNVGILSFLMNGAHPSDVGTLLDQQGVAVRTGHHCAQPLMAHFGIPGTIRASFTIYNTFDDVERLFAALEKARSFL
jgi:cysteine desulfurase / selenocysteine lyase